MFFRILSRKIKVNIPHDTKFLECLLSRLEERELKLNVRCIVHYISFEVSLEKYKCQNYMI